MEKESVQELIAELYQRVIKLKLENDALKQCVKSVLEAKAAGKEVSWDEWLANVQKVLAAL